jgi:hypothetical protein
MIKGGLYPTAMMTSLPETDAPDLFSQSRVSRSVECLPKLLEVLWAAHPVPPRTSDVADKEFFDALSGDA